MNTLPTYAERRRNFTQAATEVAGSAQGPHVSIKGNRFTLIDAAGNEKLVTTRDDQGRDCLDFIIANIHTQGKVNRVYYAAKYVPGQDENLPPTCFSDNGVAPSSQAREPQSATCGTCQWSVWGSAISENGVKKPACASAKKLAIIQPGSKMVFGFRVPPASLSNFSNYAKSVSGYTGANGQSMSVADVVTRVFFLSQGVVDFLPIAQIDATDLAAVEAMWANPAALEDVVGNHDQPWTGPITAPQAQIPIAIPSQVAPPPLPQPGQLTGTVQPFNAQPANPSTLPPEKPKRGRPKKEDVLAQGQPATGPQPLAATTAPFMQPTLPQQAPPFAAQPPPEQAAAALNGASIQLPPFLQRQPAQAANPQAAPFGIASNPAAPNAELQAALQQALNLPT